MILNAHEEGYALFADSIRKGQLKRLIIMNLLINGDLNIFNALPGSEMKTLVLENINFRQDLRPLIEALPKTPSLNILYLMGRTKNFDHEKLINILSSTRIETLGLLDVNLTHNDTILLSSVAPSTKLKRLDIRYNNLEKIITMSNFRSVINLKPGFKVVLSD